MSESPCGMIGLGRMGAPMAANLAAKGTPLVVFDVAGSAERAPEGALPVGSAAAVAERASVVFLSLPDGAAVEEVVGELLGSRASRLRQVVDTSTVGLSAATRCAEACAGAGIEYVDAPVSGGVAGARAGTLTVMLAASQATADGLRPLLLRLAKQVFRVGERAGQGQAMKLLNNFLSGAAMAATSEAIAFGMRQGLEMETMLEVLNVSTGRSAASQDKFPERILTGSYDSGFLTRLLCKDLRLYREAVEAVGAAAPLSPTVCALWEALVRTDVDGDFTRIYPFVRDGNFR